ncbi:MAG TPA: site-specific DNA-methyltransferase [Mucilaginibacter sp.]|jgi:site-specific DNA-methyltransferase (adenine-specific)|nr:site-specific DNA-methyltransferase [Mucilaginibacter sp.]
MSTQKDFLEINESTVFIGDALKIIEKLPSKSVQCIITSPPYWGMRDYNITGQIGLEETLEQYLNNLLKVFCELMRVLKDDGLLWLNIGDGYTSGNRKYRASDKKNPARKMESRPNTPSGLKPKDLIGIPWRLALLLQAHGWYLRNDIIWHKPNAMPESVKDRPYRNHEYLFMFSKSEKYFFNYDVSKRNSKKNRSVWEVPIKPNSFNHNAVFPEGLIVPCIKLSTKNDSDYVLDPFFGSGTVGAVCEKIDRKYIGIELNPEYIDSALVRINKVNYTKNQSFKFSA